MASRCQLLFQRPFTGTCREVLCVVIAAGLFSVTLSGNDTVLNQTDVKMTKGTTDMNLGTTTDSAEKVSNTTSKTPGTNWTAGTNYWTANANIQSWNTAVNWHQMAAVQRNATVQLHAYIRDLPACMYKVMPREPMPDDLSTFGVTFNINVGVTAVVEVNDAKRTITSYIFMWGYWTDPQLQWNPDEYSGVQNVEISEDAIWIPSVILANSLSRVDITSNVNYVNVSYQGLVFVTTLLIVETYCKMDLEKYPYDKQRCPLIFFTYSEDVHIRIQVSPVSAALLEAMSFSSEWTLLGVNASSLHLDKYSRYHYIWLELERKTRFYTMCLVLPLVLTSYMNTLVFLLPVQSGEKASFIVTMFVSTAFFFGFLSGVMPKGLDSVPTIMKLLVGVVVQSLLVLLATIYVMRRQMMSSDVTTDELNDATTNQTSEDSKQYLPVEGAHSAADLLPVSHKGNIGARLRDGAEMSGEMSTSQSTRNNVEPNHVKQCAVFSTSFLEWIFFVLSFVAITLFHFTLWF